MKLGSTFGQFTFVLRRSRPYAWAVILFLVAVLLNSGVIVLFSTLLAMLTKAIPQTAEALRSMTQDEIDAAINIAKRLLYIGIPASLGLLVFHGAAFFLRRFLSLKIAIDLREQICRHTLSLPIRYFSKSQTGDLISRFTNDLTKAERSIEIFWGEMIGPLITLLALIPAAFYISWKISALSLIALPAIVLLVRSAARKILSASQESSIQLGSLTEMMREMVDAVRVVKVFQLEGNAFERFHARAKAYYRATLRAIRAAATNAGVMEGLTYLIIVVLSSLGCYFTLKGNLDLSLEKLGALFFLLSEIYKNIKALTKSHNALSESYAGVERIEELLAEPAEEEDPSDAVTIDDIRDAIEFKDVTFAYDDDAVLNSLSFRVEAGKTAALVGRSGAGKTTVFNLLARFYDASKGTVTIDNVDIRKIKRSSYLAKLAYVTQDAVVFNDTIFNNIRYGKLDATEDEVMEAARNAHVLEFAREFPEGMQTVVGERGSKLSGGQRQRLTIARAMLRNAPLLLLDEATSALDSESEQAVQQALGELLKGRTTIAIAHRLSTIRNADIILVLEDGRLVESGSHDELIALDGHYAKLSRMQSTGEVGHGS
ncbi:MAG: lipid A export permease/ATP-binding protein MsbA [Planctomycetota bacterium]